MGEIEFHDIPAGCRDKQGPGSYRLLPGSDSSIFSFSNGPDSFKRFLHPPAQEIFTFKKSKGETLISPSFKEEMPIAFVGMRACDISALKLYDMIFLEGTVIGTGYKSLRKDLIIIAVNCAHPGDNCFCYSIGAGPEAKNGFDIVITELDDSLLIETGTACGTNLLKELPFEEASEEDMNKKLSIISDCIKRIKKSIRFNELPMLIYKNLEHPEWAEIARRDLQCGNCTQVCPTCFCNSSYDYIRLPDIKKKPPEISGTRIRIWDSCFSKNFARVHGGNFRPSRKARYRHWMSHKLAYMFDQFGMIGCVGCGRCITWCPVGIDITEELEALKK
jgi:ferredoxin